MKKSGAVQKPELLAPAGTYEKLRFAFAYGADAVYAGLPQFSLRTRENKFDLESVKKGIEYTHFLGKKIYITANIYAHNFKIGTFLKAMDKVIPLGPDAFIMSDPGLIHLIKEKYPEINIHLSTQANNTNWAQVKFWASQGVNRVILARELNLKEITEIVENTPESESEVFVHGAMCMAYSGRCLLSDYSTGRPSNLGTCSHDCRWEYKEVTEKERPNEKMRVEQDEHGTYMFNSKDLCALEFLPEIIQTGVKSLKIEGRNKNFLYLATTVKIYREAIDLIWEGKNDEFKVRLPEMLLELEKINRRGYTSGFFKGRLKDASSTINKTGNEVSTHEFGGLILKPQTEKRFELNLKGKISVGDTVEWITPNGTILEKLSSIQNHKGEAISTVSPGNKWNPSIFSDHDLGEFSVLRVKAATPSLDKKISQVVSTPQE